MSRDPIAAADLAAVPLFQRGARVRFRENIGVYGCADFPAHAAGTVVSLGERGLESDACCGEIYALVMLDDAIPDLEEWTNCAQVFLTDSEVTPAAFEAAPPDQPRAVAAMFAYALTQSLSDDAWRSMRERNRDDAERDCCHSHDFCDANMVMQAAVEDFLGRSILPADDGEMSNDDLALWNAAWAIAKERFLTAPPPEEAPAPQTSPTGIALAYAIGILEGFGAPAAVHRQRLQAMLDQRGCEHFDAACDGSLTSLIDIIIDG